MQSIGITIAYDGTRYVGWQIQPNGPTIQARIEEALAQLTGETIRIQGASRTDSGVHATGQVAVFRTASTIPPEKFALALNSRLPDDIAVTGSRMVAESFDPRRHARRKLYRYRIAPGPVRPILDRHMAWHIKHPLDIDEMQKAASLFSGTHDFTTFSNQECNAPDADNERTIDRSELTVAANRIIYEIEGRSFLYNMVRNIVGCLVDVGQGRFRADDIPALFDNRDRQAAGQGAPAKGLCLVKIDY